MSPRPLLRVLPHPEERQPDVHFCGYCGHQPAPDETSRICGACDLGMVLVAAAAVVPRAGQPSLIVDHALRICAVSSAAERLLHVDEADAVGSPLGQVLLPAQAEGAGLESLVATVLAAADPDAGPQRAVVRPAGEWGVRYAIRVGACGPPRAALLVLDDDDV